MRVAWALLAACATLLGAAAQPQGFVRISGNQFVDDTCSEVRFAGWNGWMVLDKALSDPAYLTRKFEAAAAAKLNVMRFFLLGDDGRLLLSSPGQLDESVAKGLDFVFAEASKHGIMLTPVLLNLWKESGVPLFEGFCGTAGKSSQPRPDLEKRPLGGLNATERLQTPYEWLMSPVCKEQVKQFITVVVSRRNSITGQLYKDDPAIFSWNLLNEPRCKYCGPEAIDQWYGELSAHLKQVDPNHLVTTGEEGFFAEGDAEEGANPTDGNLWASRSGQDFRANLAHPGIDYAVIHLWPDNWRSPPFDTSFAQRWIDAHAAVASQLGKPLVLEEFGKNAAENEIASIRDPWFSLTNGAVEASLGSGGALRGALFWQWDGESGPRPDNGSNIRQYDSTFTGLIQPFAHKIAAKGLGPVPGCTPRGSGAGAASNGQTNGQTNGQAGGSSGGLAQHLQSAYPAGGASGQNRKLRVAAGV